MRWLCALLFVTCVFADDLQDRKSKLPFIADAVGNKIPPPSNGPAPVGSPSNLLTPDRYEFYTFDESGELVKRLMTLEEIQAIVAAGEGNEGHLVTFANDDQPNIAFNFSQAPFTKVHNVVTNVQNVLKAQMEAQKNNPPTHTALDTPDVSDSWSLILPTIFGNTGAEIIPDKSSNTHTVPETDTLEFDNQEFEENSLSKEGDSDVLSSVATTEYTTQKTQPTSKITTSTSTTTPSTTISTTTMITTTPKSRPTTTTTTTQKPRITSTTTEKPRTASTSTAKPSATSTTTEKPRTTSTTTTKKPTSTTSVTKKIATSTTFSATTVSATTTTTTTTTTPRATTTLKPRITTTVKPIVQSTTLAPKSSTAKVTTIRQPVSTSTSLKPSEAIKVQATTQNKSKPPSITTVKTTTQENIDSFVPVSTVAYVTTERTTTKSTESPKTTAAFVSTTKRSVTSSKVTSTISPISTEKQIIVTTYKPATHTPHLASSTLKDQDIERIENTTTLTTQSVSPSTTVSSTEFMSVEHKPNSEELIDQTSASVSQNNEPQIPMFDIAQSISQITSDLGNNNYPIAPTSNNLLDDTKPSGVDLESKENLEMDIPTDSKNDENKQTFAPQNVKDNSDNFIKISTLDPPLEMKHKNKPSEDIPHTKIEEIPLNEEVDKITIDKGTPVTEAALATITTIDPILSGSMDDLLLQVVNQDPQTIVQNTDKPINYETTTTTPTTENLEVSEKITTESSQKANEKLKDKLSEKITSSTESSMSKTDEIKESQAKLPLKQEEESMAKKQYEHLQTQEEKFVQISTFNSKGTPTSSTVAPSSAMVPNDLKEQKQEGINGHQGFPSNDSIKNKDSQKLHKESIELLNDKINNHSKESNSSLKKIENNKDLNSISDQNKLQNVPKTEKISDLKPKIDEIKKKFQKVNIDDKELVNERNSSWKLISTVKPTKGNEVSKDKTKSENNYSDESDDNKDINLDVSKENQGLEVTTKDLDGDIAQFTELCNELAFRYWHSLTENIEKRRSFVLSPYSITSMLAMMFMGAKGATSGEMNEILKLDDMVTFNPHFTLKNISDSIETTSGSGVIVSAFVRELYSDRNKGKILTFYKERAQHFYNGHVEEVNFKLISDIIRRRTNLLVKRYSWGRIQEYMKTNSITMQPPLAALSTNVFQTDCTGTSVEGRDGEMYFVVSPNVRQRRLVPVPAVVYKKGFLAGYDPVLDATAAALGNTNSIISTLFLMPGQQGNVVHAEDLEALERRLLESNPTTAVWNRLLRTLLPRIGLELQIPRFSHKSIFNVSSTLKTMGLKDLFNAEHADLGGLNGPSKDLYLSDMIQLTSFATCGEDVIAEQHHIEEYPESLDVTRRRRTSRWANGWDEPRDYQRAFHDPHDVGDAMHLPLHLRPRQARLPARNAQPARLKFDRPFLFFVRHNPSGMILYVGRYNPRLLP